MKQRASPKTSGVAKIFRTGKLIRLATSSRCLQVSNPVRAQEATEVLQGSLPVLYANSTATSHRLLLLGGDISLNSGPNELGLGPIKDKLQAQVSELLGDYPL